MTTTQTPNTTARRITISAETFNDKGYCVKVEGIAFRNGIITYEIGFTADECWMNADPAMITSHNEIDTRDIVEINEGDEVEIEGRGIFRVGEISPRHYDVAMTPSA